ncbi:MAG: OmpA family protein [Thermodesulfobacteriota bacterium]
MASKRANRIQERFDVWPGFTDIMVGVFLVFAFVLTLFTITETILSQSLGKKDEELSRLHQEISKKIEELEQLKIEIARLERLFELQVEKTAQLAQELAQRTEQLKLAGSEIEQKTQALTEQELTLASLRSKLDAVITELNEKSSIVQAQEKLLAEERRRVAAAQDELGEKSRLLSETDARLSQLGRTLERTEETLGKTKRELTEKSSLVQDFRDAIAALNQKISLLNKQIAGYLDEIGRLNRLLADAQERESAEKIRTASLQKEISSLTTQLDQISKKLAAAEADRAKEFRVAQLVDLLGKKDKEIERLRKLAQYRSEFLARLERVFAGVPDIKVQGDRFVFQSEILFAPGRAEINETGKSELDKFVGIYREMSSKIPKDLPVLILVQGHTDIDPVRSARYKSNWELSAARSLEVVRYMIEKGIPPNRVGVAALSEFHPAAAGASLEAKRLNRRIEIKITTL